MTVGRLNDDHNGKSHSQNLQLFPPISLSNREQRERVGFPFSAGDAKLNYAVESRQQMTSHKSSKKRRKKLKNKIGQVSFEKDGYDLLKDEKKINETVTSPDTESKKNIDGVNKDLPSHIKNNQWKDGITLNTHVKHQTEVTKARKALTNQTPQLHRLDLPNYRYVIGECDARYLKRFEKGVLLFLSPRQICFKYK